MPGYRTHLDVRAALLRDVRFKLVVRLAFRLGFEPGELSASASLPRRISLVVILNDVRIFDARLFLSRIFADVGFPPERTITRMSE